MHMDIFNQDAFSLRSMTAYINKAPRLHTYLGDLGIFSEGGVSTLNVTIEEKQGSLSLIPNSQRGTSGNTIAPERRNVRSFQCGHKQINERILADEILGVRRFGSEDQLTTVTEKVADRMEIINNSFEQTFEFMRISAIKGIVYDADMSTVICNLFDEFGIQKYTKTLALTKDKNEGKIKTFGSELMRRTQKVLGMTPYEKLMVLCGDQFFDQLLASEEFKIAFERHEMGKELRESQVDTGVKIGDLFFYNYQGYVGEKSFIDTDKAYLCPVGVQNLFRADFAPADYEETVNTEGIRLYARQERLPMNKGIDLEVQSNPFFCCTRPGVLCEISLQVSNT